jgi:hypothetical protein
LQPQISQIAQIREGKDRGSAHYFSVPEEFLRCLPPNTSRSVICEMCGICGLSVFFGV